MYTSASRVGDAQWRKSHYSGFQGNCVELAAVGSSDGARVAVRNSRFPDDPVLLLTRAELGSLLDEVKAGGFDDLLEGA